MSIVARDEAHIEAMAKMKGELGSEHKAALAAMAIERTAELDHVRSRSARAMHDLTCSHDAEKVKIQIASSAAASAVARNAKKALAKASEDLASAKLDLAAESKARELDAIAAEGERQRASACHAAAMATLDSEHKTATERLTTALAAVKVDADATVERMEAAHESVKRGLSEKVTAAEAQVVARELSIEKLTEQLHIERGLKANLQTTVSRQVEELACRADTVAALESQVASKIDSIVKMSDQLEAERSQVTELRMINVRLTEEVASQTTRLATAEGQLTASELSMETLSGRLENERHRNGELEKMVSCHQQDLASKAAELSNKTEMIASRDLSIEALNVELERQCTRKSELEDEILLQKDQLARQAAKLTTVEMDLTSLTKAEEISALTIAELNNKLQEITASLGQKRSEHGAVVKALESERAANHQLISDAEALNGTIEKQSTELCAAKKTIELLQAQLVESHERDVKDASEAADQHKIELAKLKEDGEANLKTVLGRAMRVAELRTREAVSLAEKAAQAKATASLNSAESRHADALKSIVEERDIAARKADEAQSTSEAFENELNQLKKNMRILVEDQKAYELEHEMKVTRHEEEMAAKQAELLGVIDELHATRDELNMSARLASERTCAAKNQADELESLQKVNEELKVKIIVSDSELCKARAALAEMKTRAKHIEHEAEERLAQLNEASAKATQAMLASTAKQIDKAVSKAEKAHRLELEAERDRLARDRKGTSSLHKQLAASGRLVKELRLQADVAEKREAELEGENSSLRSMLVKYGAESTSSTSLRDEEIENLRVTEAWALKETERLTDENARLAGHHNHKQRIHYLKRVKGENVTLKKTNAQLEATVGRQARKLARLQKQITAAMLEHVVGIAAAD